MRAPTATDKLEISVCKDCELLTDRTYVIGHVNYGASVCDRCGVNPAWFVLSPLADEPQQCGQWFGYPESCSTSLAVERLPTVVWDVNMYYRHLGVPVDATRKEIRTAYQALGNNPSSRLTMIVKTLLDPDLRFRYDMTEPGHLWMDEEIAAVIRRARIEESERLRKDHEAWGEDLVFDEDFETAEEILDNERSKNQDVGHDSWDDEDVTPWPYSYYAWRTDARDTDRLALWQRLLVKAISDRGVALPLVVGLVGHSRVPFQIRKIGSNRVVFLSDTVVPNEVNAKMAASRLHMQVNGASAL